MEGYVSELAQGTSLYIGDEQAERNPADIESTFGLRIARVTREQFYEALAACRQSDAESELLDWEMYFAHVVGPSREDLLNATKVYLTLRQLCQVKSAHSLAMNCGPMWNERPDVVPCLAFARLMDEGIICACEGDLSSLLALRALHLASGEAPIMGNFSLCDSEHSHTDAAINHCIIPRSWSNTGSFTVRDYHGRGFGVTGYAETDVGTPITLVRIDRELKNASVYEGTVVGSDEGTCRVRITVRLEIPNGEIEQLLGGHASIVRGRHGSAAVRLLTEAGIQSPVAVGKTGLHDATGSPAAPL